MVSSILHNGHYDTVHHRIETIICITGMAHNDDQNFGKRLNPNAESYEQHRQKPAYSRQASEKSILSAESAEFDPLNTLQSDSFIVDNDSFSSNNLYHMPSTLHSQSLPSFIPINNANTVNQQQQMLFDTQHCQQQQMLIDTQLQSHIQQQQQPQPIERLIPFNASSAINLRISNLSNSMKLNDTIPINKSCFITNPPTNMNTFQTPTIISKPPLLLSRSLSLEIQIQQNEKMNRPQYERPRTTIKDILHKSPPKHSPSMKVLNAFKGKKYTNCRNEEFEIVTIS